MRLVLGQEVAFYSILLKNMLNASSKVTIEEATRVPTYHIIFYILYFISNIKEQKFLFPKFSAFTLFRVRHPLHSLKHKSHVGRFY